ncbi:Secreted effector protein pipB2 [Burkholderia sp. AD24]|nr:Secreted effector protein pipB2 [Burkholderia sp. AD24]
MKIVKPLSLGTLTRSYQIGGERRFVVSALGFFPLGEAAVQRFAMENEQWPGVLKTLATQGVTQPLDEVLPKSRAELLVSGNAYAPQGKPVERMQVSLSAAGVDKTLDVIGERVWRYAPWLRIDAPKPFVSMPLAYTHAFGGAHHPDNPVGCGYERNRFAALAGVNTRPMPNLELPGTPVRRHWVRYAPAGFGPLAFDWQTRSRHAGRYGAKWLAHEAPGFSSSATPALFQRAPADQWLAAYLQGGEPYRLCGMHPQRAVIEGQVPPLVARGFIQRSGAASLEEVALRFDTVWFFPDLLTGVAMYHGETPHAHSLGFDIDAVMVAYEHRDRPRSFAHYAQVFALRTDPATAAAHLFNESDLAADFDAPTRIARAAASAARADQAAAAEQAQLDAQLAEFYAVSGMTPPPAIVVQATAGTATTTAATDAPAKPTRLPRLDSVAIAESDFDLAPMLDGARNMIAEARAQADRLRASLPELPTDITTATPDPAARREAAWTRISVAAVDLVPLDPMVGLTPPSRNAASPAPAVAVAPESTGVPQLDAALAAQPAQARAARRASLRYTDPDGPLPPDLARWLGRQVEQWHRAGVLLAGRDLAGIDLSGLDLSDADLREVQLENADLRNTRLSGARLDRAVLSGAQLDGADFTRATLIDANLCHSSGARVGFSGADLTRAWALDAQWPQADLSDACLDHCLASGIGLAGARLQRLTATQAVLLNANAPSSDWQAAQLAATVLMRADLSGASFANATLRKTVLMDAKLIDASFEGATLVDVPGGGTCADWSNARMTGLRAEHCSWQLATLRGSDWRSATLAACDLGRTDLSGAQLSDGQFSCCLFTAATLTGARAERANLFRAVCREVNFTDASLVAACLYQADTSDALFTRADLRDVQLEAGRRAIA